MVATVEPKPIVSVSVEEAVRSKGRTRMKVALEVAAGILGILLASWSGPTVQEYFAPKIHIVCPICNWGPNEPRQP